MPSALASTTAQLSHVPADWIAIGIVFLVVAIDAFRSGTTRAVAIVLASTATLALVALLPHAAVIGPMIGALTAPVARSGLVAGVWVGAFIFSHRIAGFDGVAPSWLAAILSGVAAAESMAVLWLQSDALQSIWHVGGQTQVIFGSAYALWWIIGAYAVLAIIRS